MKKILDLPFVINKNFLLEQVDLRFRQQSMMEMTHNEFVVVQHKSNNVDRQQERDQQYPSVLVEFEFEHVQNDN